MTDTVRVTGGSGYLAGHAIRRLLDDGYRVRTTFRSLDREAEVRATIDRDAGQLSFVAADLISGEGWCVRLRPRVAHGVAVSPHQPKDEEELIEPAPERHPTSATRGGGCRSPARGGNVLVRGDRPLPQTIRAAV
jgi:dihydroflavonol-4-reductase